METTIFSLGLVLVFVVLVVGVVFLLPPPNWIQRTSASGISSTSTAPATPASTASSTQSTASTTTPPPQAYILQNTVTHTRLLPAPSKHTFTYPAISLLVSLDALERGDLDLLRGWAFGYGGLWGRLTGIRPDPYLMPGKESIREKLERVLLDRGYGVGARQPKSNKTRCSANDEKTSGVQEAENKQEEEAEAEQDVTAHIWMMTMPSYMGFEGINPLTVYYCYTPEGGLAVVVLEVHNTFGENHVYILQVGKDEDEVRPGSKYDHQWTFPRAFHVSPFNDRSGYYVVSICDPGCPPSTREREKDSTTKERDSATTTRDLAAPLPSVKIHMYTEKPSSASPADHTTTQSSSPFAPDKLKLLALLNPRTSTPLTSSSLLAALSQAPFSLFLALPRILGEAAVLHYGRGLRVWGRPEPVVEVGRARSGALQGEEEAGDEGGEGAPTRRQSSSSSLRKGIPTRVVAGGAVALKRAGGVRWQPESPLDAYARGLHDAFLRKRAQEVGVCVEVWAPDGFGAGPEVFGRETVSKRVYGEDDAGSEDDAARSEDDAKTTNSNARNTPASSPSKKLLRISYTSPAFFRLLLLSPSAAHALLLARSWDGQEEGRLFEVSDEDVFLRVYSTSSTTIHSSAAGDADCADATVDPAVVGEKEKPQREERLSRRQTLRSKVIPDSLSRTLPIPPRHFLDVNAAASPARASDSTRTSTRTSIASTFAAFQATLAAVTSAFATLASTFAALASTLAALQMHTAIWLILALDDAEAWVFAHVLRARMVSGTEPWWRVRWRRAAESLSSKRRATESLSRTQGTQAPPLKQ
ncbi:hypothetical protein CYLTODRAFT_493562 [Cylindrobasidium torrendii FP15055 ss-10]|uniref:DUF1365-domain-containing protein n=1 Tax=Cylindrobasidium torrendii FP15055 ss-10 TaxID=1314674 RepID=A0A0D7B081_9AGAR|nr:hypothetical protein CYLTODRAFT_493562 [Cylindrobasidium torrendii FP15055 ss-10]